MELLDKTRVYLEPLTKMALGNARLVLDLQAHLRGPLCVFIPLDNLVDSPQVNQVELHQVSPRASLQQGHLASHLLNPRASRQ